jgi:hypothetical protein
MVPSSHSQTKALIRVAHSAVSRASATDCRLHAGLPSHCRFPARSLIRKISPSLRAVACESDSPPAEGWNRKPSVGRRQIFSFRILVGGFAAIDPSPPHFLDQPILMGAIWPFHASSATTFCFRGGERVYILPVGVQSLRDPVALDPAAQQPGRRPDALFRRKLHSMVTPASSSRSADNRTGRAPPAIPTLGATP